MSETKVTINAELTPHVVVIPWECNDNIERPLTIKARLLYDQTEGSRDLLITSVEGHGASEFLASARQFVMLQYMQPQLNEGSEYIHDTLRNLAADLGKALTFPEWESLYPDLYVKIVEPSC